MRDENAQKLLAKVMGWTDIRLTDAESVTENVDNLQLLANYKYDRYQRYGHGKRFIESLALWLQQFKGEEHKKLALEFIKNELIYFSEEEMTHLVRVSYRDFVLRERTRLVAEEEFIPSYKINKIRSHKRFVELGRKSLYLGLSDGARTNEFRRSGNDEISNEQIWQAYELGDEKARDMIKDLNQVLGTDGDSERFTHVWLLDDFSGSGNTYIRYDDDDKKFKGKIPKIYDRLYRGDLINRDYFEVFLLLYVATKQAVDHINYWSYQYALYKGYKPIQIRVVYNLDENAVVRNSINPKSKEFMEVIVNNEEYFDEKANDKHTKVGGTNDVKLGFADCCLPLVLSHNTPNNSLFILWAYDHFKFRGLFPRVSRHKEF